MVYSNNQNNKIIAACSAQREHVILKLGIIMKSNMIYSKDICTVRDSAAADKKWRETFLRPHEKGLMEEPEVLQKNGGKLVAIARKSFAAIFLAHCQTTHCSFLFKT